MKKANYFLVVLIAWGGLSSCEVEDVSLVKLTKVEVNRIEKQEMYLDVSAILDNSNPEYAFQIL